jgi:hypothetical protein
MAIHHRQVPNLVLADNLYRLLQTSGLLNGEYVGCHDVTYWFSFLHGANIFCYTAKFRHRCTLNYDEGQLYR